MIFNRQLRELPYFQTNPIWKLGEQVSLIFLYSTIRSEPKFEILCNQ